METSAVATACAEKLIRFLAIRVISDDAQTDLPREVASVLANGGSYRAGAALRAVWQRPSSVKDFWSLYEHAIEAAGRLGKFFRFVSKSFDHSRPSRKAFCLSVSVEVWVTSRSGSIGFQPMSNVSE